MNRRTFLHTIPLAFVASRLAATERFGLLAGDDEALCLQKFEFAVSRSLQTKPINEVVVEIGKTFLGTEYVAHALEVPGEERLVVNMRGLDCVSFCENAVVLARCIKLDTMTFDDYKRQLQYLRYRGGIINRYPSRLHYFSDYIHDGEKKKVWKNITRELGGRPYRKIINFMTTHIDSYRQLKENPEFVEEMRRQEEELSRREMVFIPKEELEKQGEGIQGGDVVAITTDVEGLDIAHTGIAVRKDGVLRLMHAPIVGSNVQITEQSLVAYLAKNKRQTGVMIARLLEPRAES